MKTQEINIELTINGTKATVGHNFLEDIARNIPDTKENSKIFDILATSNNYEVREHISRFDSLSTEAIAKFLEDDFVEVVDNILCNRDINKYITDEQLNGIIEKEDIKLLCTIASNINDYKNCNVCKVIKKLSKYPNAKVRYSLLRWRVSDLLTTKILEELAKDSDADVACKAKKELENRMG
jgi:hypothetical protein